MGVAVDHSARPFDQSKSASPQRAATAGGKGGEAVESASHGIKTVDSDMFHVGGQGGRGRGGGGLPAQLHCVTARSAAASVKEGELDIEP